MNKETETMVDTLFNNNENTNNQPKDDEDNVDDNKITEIVEPEYKPSAKELLNLQTQLNVNDKDALKLLLKHKGNIVECIIDKYEEDDGVSYPNPNLVSRELERKELEKSLDNIDETYDENDSKENIKLLRHVVEEKNKLIANSKFGEKDVDISDVETFYYIAFTYNTKKFEKQKKYLSRDNILNILVKDYLENNYLHHKEIQFEMKIIKDFDNYKLKLAQDKNSDAELINITEKKDYKLQLECSCISKLKDGSPNRLASKWKLKDGVMFYFTNQIVDSSKKYKKLIKKYTNEQATKLLRKTELIKDYETLIGPCIIVDEWDNGKNDSSE